MYKFIILGSGAAGLSAAIYAARYKVEPLVIGETNGGTANLGHLFENYPGFESIAGAELMEKFVAHARKFGTEIKNEKVLKLVKIENGFAVQTEKEKYECESLLIALGTQHRKLNVPGEDRLTGRGVSYCFTCDGYFFKDKVVGVVGGNDSAATAALFLADAASRVYVIYRREALRAEPIWLEKIKQNSKIEVITKTQVVEIVGEQKVESVKLDQPYKDSSELKLDGLFIEAGAVPASALVESLGVEVEGGFIKVKEDMSTNVSGVYAAGDISTGSAGLRQVATATAEGAIAAYAAYKWLKGKRKK